MTEELKKELVSHLIAFAIKFEIQNTSEISFKKRNILFEKIKVIDAKAHDLIFALFQLNIQLDRIEKDVEKKLKKPELWQLEKETTEKFIETVLEEVKLFKKNK